MQTIGERLEEARKKKGISIREAAEATKIRGDYLQKFESNHFDIGLTEIYTRGFLRSYAAFLKLPSERILNDYAALGRGELRPRQPSREVYGRMDISVSTAGESSDRAAPPEDGAADAEPARPRPRSSSRIGSSLPPTPAFDPALVFRYVKYAGIGAVVIIAGLVIWSFASRGSASAPAAAPTAAATPAPAATTGTTGALPPVATQPAVSNKVVIYALDIANVQVWAQNKDGTYGKELLPSTTLARGQSVSVPKSGPIYIFSSAQENIRLDINGRQFFPSAPPANARGASSIVLD